MNAGNGEAHRVIPSLQPAICQAVQALESVLSAETRLGQPVGIKACYASSATAGSRDNGMTGWRFRPFPAVHAKSFVQKGEQLFPKD